ncbi:MAG: LarC family nickel insertion protein, partial [Pseudomonadota bacterium]
PLHVGSGFVKCDHGTLPVPAPATAELTIGKPVYSTGVTGELLTPTGAAILTTIASSFGPMPLMRVETIGYGAGTSDPAIPNVLRLVVGELIETESDYETEQVGVLETNIDDMNPQMYDYVMEKMQALGALDVFMTPCQMKKNRPGTLLTAVCPVDAIDKLADFLIMETTTIGLRWRIDDRIKASRTVEELTTKYGPIKVKIARAGHRIANAAPEYDDCKRAALEKGVRLKAVMDEARAAIVRREMEIIEDEQEDRERK